MRVVSRWRWRRSSAVAAAVALAAPLLALPGVAGAEEQVPSGDVVVGTLVQAWAEHEDHAEAAARSADGPLTWIETGAGDSVRLATDDLARTLGADAGGATEVPVGATVEVVVGEEVVDAATTEEGMEPALEVLAAEVVEPVPAEAAPLPAAVTNEVTVVMMIPAGGTAEPGRTLQQVLDAVDGPVATFWSDQTGGTVQVRSAATHVGSWVQATVDCSNASALWAEAATAAGWTEGSGKHLLVYLPRNSPGCAYGLAQVGPSPTYGGRLYVTDVATSALAHEFGHNFGLGHSSGLQCDRATDTGSCRVEAYRDYYDVMGFSWDQVGSLNAPNAARLGVLPADQQRTVDPAAGLQTFTLTAAHARSAVRAVRMTDPGGAVYWLELRQAGGQDGWLAGAPLGLEQGVLLRRAGGMPNTSLLLDGSPSPRSGWSADLQAALPVGQQVLVAGGQYAVEVSSVSSGSAVVSVSRPLATAAGVSTHLAALRGVSSLYGDQQLVSPNGSYRAVFQGDGNLVVYGPGGRVVWAAGTAAPGGSLVLQADGNLVVYRPGARPVWATRTASSVPVWLVMQDDGNLVLYREGAGPLWATGGDRRDLLRTGETLRYPNYLQSRNGAYRAVAQPDGNFVVYGPGGRVMFHSRTSGSGVGLVMQRDGNAVLYAGNGRPLWATGTGYDPASAMVMQDDGNLVVYRGNGTPAWAALR